ncbi:MAG: PKD domain-containing protein [Bacteroidales bacterium]|nr:PKD domain-containing protein [Bacteroidales bacterium]MCF8350709.1 PKD domain-containing protein [Bacteroidales bacterium]MCF8377520.1 PKD domain-containing protein [Bacteroidales bacterium]MCF8401813.1 PKD domain-containing protein [Bacteroidales bacterium]
MKIHTNKGRGLRYLFLGALFLLIITKQIQAQFPPYTVNPNVTPEEMVEILVGEGIDFFNVTYSGVNIASGSFQGESNIGIESGIILTSGHAEISEGPNNSGSAGENNGQAGDSDLTQISGSNTNDACVLEFDFVPQSRKVEFRYVFGSEEYEEYVWAGVNDSFGFFISGPGINGEFSHNSKNIALIPLTYPPVYVSIDSVNHRVHTDYYENNNGGQSIQYDGFTTVLTAGSLVKPCSTYHIKLVIGDGGDYIYDSGVFLEENSFSSVGVLGSVSYQSDFIDTIAVEDCNSASIRFAMDVPLDFDYHIALDIMGTAENGVDYDTINDTLTIPAFYRFADLEILPWDEGDDTEIFETVKLAYNTSFCEVNMDTIEIEIWDPIDFQMIAREDTLVHCGDSVNLYTLADGFPPFYHIWSTGDTTMWIPGNDSLGNGNTIRVGVQHPTEYWVKVWDECRHDTIIDTIFVDVVGPTGTVSEDTIQICLNESASMEAYGGDYYVWSTGDTAQQITVTPDYTTEYTVRVYDDCDNFDEDTVLVQVIRPNADAGNDTTICLGEAATLQASGIGAVFYQWEDGPAQQEYVVSPTGRTCYVVHITDICNNTASDTVCVDVNDGVQANAGQDRTICYGDTIMLVATGGEYYEWNNGMNNDTIFVSPPSTTDFIVTVTEGCSDTDTVKVKVDPLPPVQATAQNMNLCYGDSLMLNAAGADTYYWSSEPADPTLIGQETSENPVVYPEETTWYYLEGTDQTTSCNTIDTLLINVKPKILTTFTSGVSSACAFDTLMFQYTGNALPGATYQWDFDGAVVSGSGQGPVYVYWEDQGDKEIELVILEDGCRSDTGRMQITVYPTPATNYSVPSREICQNDIVQFTNESENMIPDATFLWKFGPGAESTEENPEYIYHETGQYDVSLTVYNDACEHTRKVNNYIMVNPLPEAGFEAEPTLTSIESPTVYLTETSSNDVQHWYWYLGDGTVIEDQLSSYTYSDTGTYNLQLVVENQYGCLDTTTKQISIKPHPKIYAPNAFRPGSTVGNDKFIPVGVGIEVFHMTIYSRWGEKVFETSEMGEGWDGTINGEPAPAGTYVYHIDYTNNLEQSSQTNGTVTIIR